MGARIDRAGQRVGRLVIMEPVSFRLNGVSRLSWMCQCDCGNVIKVRADHLSIGKTSSCGCLHRDVAREHCRTVGLNRRGVPCPREYKQGEVAYGTVHQRLRRDRGRAATHQCVDCGQGACDWSYDYSSYGEFTSPRPYSLDQDRYMPRCRRCHKKHDLAFLREKKEGGFFD